MENNAFAQKIYFKGFNERKINYLKFDENSENINISNNSSNIPMRNISNNNEHMQIGKLNVQNINSNTNLTHQGTKNMNFENEYINNSTQNNQNFNIVHGNSGYSNSQLLFLNKNMNSNNSINTPINNIGNLNSMYNFNKNLKSNDILKDNMLNKNVYNDFKHGDNKMDFNNLNMKSFTKSRNMNIHNVNNNSNISGNSKLILNDLNSDHIGIGNKNTINDSYINSYNLNINNGNIPGHHKNINNYDNNVIDKASKTDTIYNTENNNNMNSDNIYLSGQTNNTLNRNNIKSNLNNFLNTNIVMNKPRNKFTNENTLNNFNSSNNELIGNNNNNQKKKNTHLKMYENDNIKNFKGIESNNDLLINHMNQEMLGNNFNTHNSNSNIGGNNMSQLANIGNPSGHLASYNRPNTHNVNIMNNNNIGNNTLNSVMHNQVTNQISNHLSSKPSMANIPNSNNMHTMDTNIGRDISNYSKNILLKTTNVNNAGSHANINNYNTNHSNMNFTKMNNMYSGINGGVNNVENNQMGSRGNLINFEYINDKDNINELHKNMILNDSSSNLKNYPINNGNIDFLNNRNGVDILNNANNFNNVNNNNNKINYVSEIQNFSNTCGGGSSANINYNMVSTMREGTNEIKRNEQIISKNVDISKKGGVGNTIHGMNSNNILSTDNYANMLKQICTPIKNRTDSNSNNIGNINDNLIINDFGDNSNEYGSTVNNIYPFQNENKNINNNGNIGVGVGGTDLTAKHNNVNANDEGEMKSNGLITGRHTNQSSSNIYELKKLNLYAESKKKKENEENDEKAFKNNIKKNKTKVFFYINPKYIIEPLKRKIYQNMSVFIENLISDIKKIENKNRAEILENLHNTPWFCMIFDFDGISKLLNVFNKYLIYSDSLIIPDLLISSKFHSGTLPRIHSGTSPDTDQTNTTSNANNENEENSEQKENEEHDGEHYEENENTNNEVKKNEDNSNNEYMQNFNFYFEKSNKFDILNKKIYDYENNIIENVEKLNYLKDLCKSLKNQVDLKKKKFLLLFEKAKLKNYIYKNKDLQTILDIEKKLATNLDQPKINNEYYTVFKKINDGLNYLKKYSNIIISNNAMYNEILNEQESGNFCESSVSTDELAHEQNLNDDLDNNNPDEDINNMNISPSNQINKRNENQNENNNDDNLFFKNKNSNLKDYEQDKEASKKRKTVNQIKNLQWDKEENEEWVDDFLEDF
ncbi:hypothetical protein YYG_03715 [Plasmodium vinckei petteri]|uniref:Asparagine-rich protein n=1 Tax=Plasmodium vinckei petteri TaxID=138298 RepID=W7ACW5_PLAVN|nr:hypothetical protein YYG_03715 [Plasmodium vinckei petteri]CAD2100008.1 conserved Plasmodium protein, unknown function [Plasmodium vinckei petteri]